MTRTAFRRIALGLMAAPLALGLAACDKKAEESAPVAEEALAKIAPPAGKQWSEVIAKTDEGGYRMGNPDAPIKLVEYGALSCSHCAEFAHEAAQPLQTNYIASGRVSYEIRFFMLNAFDIPATLLATCGSTEAVIPLAEQFWAWQPNMFTNMQAKSEAEMNALSELPRDQQFAAVAQASGMTDFYASRGISRDQAQQCLANAAKAKELADQTQKAGTEKNITGTPTFFINGTNIGTANWEGVEAKLQQAGAR